MDIDLILSNKIDISSNANFSNNNVGKPDSNVNNEDNSFNSYVKNYNNKKQARNDSNQANNYSNQENKVKDIALSDNDIFEEDLDNVIEIVKDVISDSQEVIAEVVNDDFDKDLLLASKDFLDGVDNININNIEFVGDELSNPGQNDIAIEVADNVDNQQNDELLVANLLLKSQEYYNNSNASNEIEQIEEISYQIANNAAPIAAYKTTKIEDNNEDLENLNLILDAGDDNLDDLMKVNGFVEDINNPENIYTYDEESDIMIFNESALKSQDTNISDNDRNKDKLNSNVNIKNDLSNNSANNVELNNKNIANAEINDDSNGEIELAKPSENKMQNNFIKSLDVNIDNSIRVAQDNNINKLASTDNVRVMNNVANNNISEQIQVNIRGLNNNSNQGKINIQLYPQSLGKVEVSMNIGTDGKTNIVFAAEKSDTLDLLKHDIKNLEKSLQDSGINADSNNMSFNLKQDNSNAEQLLEEIELVQECLEAKQEIDDNSKIMLGLDLYVSQGLDIMV